MGDVRDLKIQYNELLVRHYKAEQFFNDINVSMEEKIYNQPMYADILHKLNQILDDFRENGVKIDDNEILGGMRV